MDICGEVVINKTFGRGKITKMENNYVTVLFDKSKEEKEFVYPNAFGTFLKMENKPLLKEIQKEKAVIVRQKAEKKRIKEKQMAKLQAKIELNKVKTSKKITKKQPNKSNIVFKCNYCDGGEDKETIGYQGICSDKIIEYNIRKAKHTCCCSEESQCYRYWNGEITKEELNDYCKENGFVCQESQMLKSWCAYAGIMQNGKNKGKPRKLNKVRVNSLALLTTKLPYAKEKERFIFAVFLVGNNHKEDNIYGGHIEAHTKYRIQLSLDEAKKLKFWDYYFNLNRPEKIMFGGGLHRYLTDIQAAQVLNKICEIKKGTSEEELSKEFLEHYCKIKQLNIDNISVPNGALQRNK